MSNVNSRRPQLEHLVSAAREEGNAAATRAREEARAAAEAQRRAEAALEDAQVQPKPPHLPRPASPPPSGAGCASWRHGSAGSRAAA